MDKIIETTINAILEKKGQDVVLLDFREMQRHFVDFFVIATCENFDHMEAVSQNIQEKLDEMSILPHHIERKRGGKWYLMDFGYFIVHLFTKEGREFYALETLWGGAKRRVFKDGEDTSKS